MQQSQLQLAYEAYQQVLLQDPYHETAKFMVSALLQSPILQNIDNVKSTDIPCEAPLDYIKKLFDNYADHFEEHLQKTLHYKVPEQLYHFIKPYMSGQSLVTLDLGCGTGLGGVVFSPVIKELTGVDISPRC